LQLELLTPYPNHPPCYKTKQQTNEQNAIFFNHCPLFKKNPKPFLVFTFFQQENI